MGKKNTGLLQHIFLFLDETSLGLDKSRGRKMKGNYLVAICDILGFSKLILRNDVETVLNVGLNFFKKSLKHSVHKDSFPDETVSYKDLRNHRKLGVAWFSDTVLLYTRKDEDDVCRQLLQIVGWLIFENMLTLNSRMRVGISYGEAFMDEKEEIYIGKPIVEAYNLEKSQEWSGGALTKKVEERFGNYLASLNPMESWVVPYNVPLKLSLRKNLLAINWTNGIHGNSLRDFNWSEKRNKLKEQDYIEQPDVVEKWKNTKEFHEKVCWQCFPSLNPTGVIKPPHKFW